jgi:hypothetical protein
MIDVVGNPMIFKAAKDQLGMGQIVLDKQNY